MQDKAQIQYKQMTETPIPRLVITLAIPTMISMVVTNIYNLADSYFVGELGKSASGAVGIVFGLMSVIQAFGFMFGQGAGSMVSRKLGARDPEATSAIASAGFFWAFVSGLAITVLGLCFLDGVMRVFGSTDTILPYARQYGLFILLAAPFMTTSFTMNTILRYEGKAALSMIGLLTGAVLNIFGDYLLMRVFHMGITGAAVSTAVSQLVSFFILLSMFLRGRTQSRIRLRLMPGGLPLAAEICKIGFPAMMRQGLASISTTVLNLQAGLFGGDAAISAMTIVNRICFFIFAVGIGLGQGFQPVSAFNFGAGKYSRVRRAFRFTLAAGEVILGVLAVIGTLLSPHLVGIFIDDAEVIRIGSFALRVQLLAIFFQPIAVTANMMFQSIAKNLQATLLSAMRSGLFFIPAILLLPRFLGLEGVQIAQAISDTLTGIVTVPFVVSFFRTLPADAEIGGAPDPAHAVGHG